jgi:hypothetical protein
MLVSASIRIESVAESAMTVSKRNSLFESFIGGLADHSHPPAAAQAVQVAPLWRARAFPSAGYLDRENGGLP